MVDVRQLTDDRLKTLIRNHEKAAETAKPAYSAAVAEWNRRKGGRLEFRRTLEIVREAATRGRFLSYGAVAEAHGANWSQVRYSMNEHLWALVKYAHARGWPMLSAVI
jgi:hypothetical protein